MNDSPLRILANASFGRGPKRPPRGDHQEAEGQALEVPPSERRSLAEQEVERIIDAQPSAGESVQRAFDRKERELHAMFAALSREESMRLHSALTAVDSLLMRMASDRRARVLASLSEIVRGKASRQ